VQPLTANKSAEDNARDASEAEKKANSDWWSWLLSVLTIAVLFGQAIILAAQAYFLSGTLKTTAIVANATQRQSRIFAAVEGPVPLIVGLKVVQYPLIPGTTILGEHGLADRINPGPISANCRVLIAFENKGRTVTRMLELCIEKFIGNVLPANSCYAHVEPWGLVLEKGPLWIQATDELANITPAEVGTAAAVYPNGAFWAYGYFAYLNLLDERVEQKFLARWDLTQRFCRRQSARLT
jgi:hypothetical protein